MECGVYNYWSDEYSIRVVKELYSFFNVMVVFFMKKIFLQERFCCIIKLSRYYEIMRIKFYLFCQDIVKFLIEDDIFYNMSVFKKGVLKGYVF